MEFEWDEQKNKQNFLKHRVDFEMATRIFDNDYIIFESKNAGSDTERFIAVGLIEDVFQTVIYTHRENKIRIISARRSRHEEKRKYRQLHDGRNKEITFTH